MPDFIVRLVFYWYSMYSMYFIFHIIVLIPWVKINKQQIMPFDPPGKSHLVALILRRFCWNKNVLNAGVEYVNTDK